MGKKPSKRWRPAVFWASVLGASSLGESAACAGNAGVRAMRKAKEKEAAVRNRTGNLSACKGSAAISRRFGIPDRVLPYASGSWLQAIEVKIYAVMLGTGVIVGVNGAIFVREIALGARDECCVGMSINRGGKCGIDIEDVDRPGTFGQGVFEAAE